MREPNPYLVNQIMTANSIQLVGYIYDAAILACYRKDKIRASEALGVLVSSLRFEHREIAFIFYEGYRLLLSQIHNSNFDKAIEMLRRLQQNWKGADSIGDKRIYNGA